MINPIYIDGLLVEFDPDQEFLNFATTAYKETKNGTEQTGNCDFYISEKNGKRVCSIFNLNFTESEFDKKSAQTATALLSLVEDVCAKRGVEAIEYSETPRNNEEARQILDFYKKNKYRTYQCKDGTITISKQLNRKNTIGKGYATPHVPYYEPATSDEFGI